MVFYADLRDNFLDLFLMTLVDENEPELSLIHFLGPKTFRVVFYCLTKVVTDILLPRRLRFLCIRFLAAKNLCQWCTDPVFFALLYFRGE